jgi:uncharacterized protein (TIGR01244 family)
VFVYADPNDSIPNLQQVRYTVFSAGQPTVIGYGQLAAMGVKTVINVLPTKECLPEEPTLAMVNGMTYHNIPFDPTQLTVKTLEEFALVLQSSEKPVLIHCSTGNHVGGMWFAYRVVIEKAPLALALKEGRRIGMQPAMEDMVFQWVTNPSLQAKL